MVKNNLGNWKILGILWWDDELYKVESKKTKKHQTLQLPGHLLDWISGNITYIFISEQKYTHGIFTELTRKFWPSAEDGLIQKVKNVNKRPVSERVLEMLSTENSKHCGLLL